MITSLTSLRFLFALAVFVHHYHLRINEEIPFFENGYIGVSFFFILSGFILSYSYKERLLTGKMSKLDFYIARFARIYPLHLLTFVICIPLLIRINSVPDWKILTSNLFLIQSWIPDRAYYFSVNQPSWSISDEAFFYAVFPVLLYFFMKKSFNTKTITVAVCLLLYISLMFLPWKYHNAHALFYINPIFRVIDFAIGIIIYSIWNQNSQKKYDFNKWKATIFEVSSIGILIFMIWFSKYIPKTLLCACYYWLPISLIIYLFAIQQKGLVSILLSKKVFVLSGEISYAFYLFHKPVINYCNIVMVKLKTIEWWNNQIFLRFILIFIALYIVSLLSFYYFETPTNRKIKSIYKNYKQNLSIR